MKRVLILLLCAIMSMAQGTDAMLFGDVKAKETGQHLPHATITVKGTTLKTKCDASGHFKMADLPVGKQIVVANLEGYQEQELEVEMISGKGTAAYFKLDKDALELSQVVVTGTRTEHFVKNVPIRTEVLTSQSIKRKNALNLFDALEGVPGIRVEQQLLNGSYARSWCRTHTGAARWRTRVLWSCRCLRLATDGYERHRPS